MSLRRITSDQKSSICRSLKCMYPYVITGLALAAIAITIFICFPQIPLVGLHGVWKLLTASSMAFVIGIAGFLIYKKVDPPKKIPDPPAKQPQPTSNKHPQATLAKQYTEKEKIAAFLRFVRALSSDCHETAQSFKNLIDTSDPVQEEEIIRQLNTFIERLSAICDFNYPKEKFTQEHYALIKQLSERIKMLLEDVQKQLENRKSTLDVTNIVHTIVTTLTSIARTADQQIGLRTRC